MTSKTKNYLFVYGTLRKGFKHSFLSHIADDMEFVGTGAVIAAMFDIGEYPAIVPTKDKNVFVEGDVFEIKNTLKVFEILDEYEGFYQNDIEKSEYLRKKSLVRLEKGNNLFAWVYWYNFPVVGKQKIINTNYLEYLQQKQFAVNI